ncbi:MAG: hypothetical protein Q8O93_02840 [bacterium]|nr:hypothetical protein [bacterium]
MSAEERKGDYSPKDKICEKGDKRIVSGSTGVCAYCGQAVFCPRGCYNSKNYDNSTEASIALENGSCLECGGKIECPSGHLTGRAPRISRFRADEPFGRKWAWS